MSTYAAGADIFDRPAASARTERRATASGALLAGCGLMQPQRQW